MSCIKDLEPEVLAQRFVVVGATCWWQKLSFRGGLLMSVACYVKPAQCCCMCPSPTFHMAVALVQAYMAPGLSTYGADT